MKNCLGCNETRGANELDLDSYCYVCASGGIQPPIDSKNVEELLAETVDQLAEARGRTPDQIKNQLITDSYGKPGKMNGRS